MAVAPMPLVAPRSDRRPRLRLLAVLLAVLPLSPRAADLLELPFQDLLQVEVRSASKRWEQVRDIPASVTILTREDIDRYGWVTFEDLLRNVPGFFVLDNIAQRFIGNRGTVGGGVQFLVNGVPQHPSRQKPLTLPEIAQLNIPVESIDRVEVIRGPMSVIYGNNAFLGVVNVVTNEIGRNGPRVSASYGSRDSGRLFARLGARSDDGFVVLNAGGYRTDGLDGAYADMMGPNQLAALVPGMHTSLDGDVPQRDLSLDLSAGWEEWTADVRWTQKHYGVYLLSPPFEDGNHVRLTTWHGALAWEHAFSETLGLRTSAIVSEERSNSYEYDFISPAMEGDQLQGYRCSELEIDLFWEPRPGLDLFAGYRFRYVDDIENRVDVPLLGLDRADRLEDVALHDLFAELGWNPTDQLRLIGGVRLSHLPDAYEYTRDDFLRGIRSEQELPVDDRNVVTGRVAALWSLDAQQVIKLIWGTAAQDNEQLSLVDPERIQTTELVYVQTQPGWTLTGSLFRNRISNIGRRIQQVDPQTGAYRSVVDNSGEWVTNGIELIGELHPLPELHLSASLTWQQTDDRESDVDIGYSPELLAKLKASWASGPMTYAAYAHYVDAMDADWDFVAGVEEGVVRRIGERVPAYWNVGLNLRWDPAAPGPYANLNVSNLLDEEIRYPANELTDFRRGLIGPGRVVMGTVGWTF
jgi:outer membrane receptor for ferrienterochelin and colicin